MFHYNTRVWHPLEISYPYIYNLANYFPINTCFVKCLGHSQYVMSLKSLFFLRMSINVSAVEDLGRGIIEGIEEVYSLRPRQDISFYLP